MEKKAKEFDKLYTATVNYLMSHPNTTVQLYVRGSSGGTVNLTAGFSGRNLINRTVVFYDINTGGSAAMSTTSDGKEIEVYKQGFYGATTSKIRIHDHDKLVQIYLTHEGFHGPKVDSALIGNLPLNNTKYGKGYNNLHQKTFNNAAIKVLGY